MDHHTREKLSAICGAFLVFALACVVLCSLASMPGGLDGSLKFSTSSAIVSDSLGREDYGFSFVYIAAEPSASARYPQWYWSVGENSLFNSPVGRSGHAINKFEDNFVNGSVLASSVNPYCGMAAAGKARLWRYPRKTSLVVFDARLFGPEKICDVAVPSRLAAHVKYGYLFSVNNADPHYMSDDAVFAQDVPRMIYDSYDAEDVFELYSKRIRGYLKAWPITVTADEHLAEFLVEKHCRVVLVGHKGPDTLNLRYCESCSGVPEIISDWIKPD